MLAHYAKNGRFGPSTPPPLPAPAVAVAHAAAACVCVVGVVPLCHGRRRRIDGGGFMSSSAVRVDTDLSLIVTLAVINRLPPYLVDKDALGNDLSDGCRVSRIVPSVLK